MTPETKWKTKVKRWWDKLGIYHIPYVPGFYGRKGVPDSLLCINGEFIGVEFKCHPNKLSEDQEKQIEKIRDAGGKVYVIYPEDFESFKEVLINESKNS